MTYRSSDRSDDDFLRGFATALASLIREYDQPTIAANIAWGNGLCLADFEFIGLDESDLKPLRAAMRAKAKARLAAGRRA